MKPLTTKQQLVVDAISREWTASVPTLMKTVDLSLKAINAHVERLELDHRIRVVDWVLGVSGRPMKVYAVGAGENVKLDRTEFKAKIKQDAKRRALTMDTAFDPNAPLAKNNGWVSTIYSSEFRISHEAHVSRMARFQPRSDIASVWVFK